MVKIKKIFRMILFKILNMIFVATRKVKENYVCFISDTNENLIGNLKSVYDKFPDGYCKKVICYNKKRRFVDLQAIYLVAKFLAISEYIFLDDMLDFTQVASIRKNQKLIQLWHGAGAYKKFGFSRESSDHIKIHTGYRKYTHAIVSSESIRSCYAEAFDIEIDKVRATGIPRTDVFFDDKEITAYKETFIEKHPIAKNKKIILFAPTYRSSNINNAYYDFDQINWEMLYEQLKDEYCIIVKWHPAILDSYANGNVEIPNLSLYDGFYIDIDDNINQLMMASDILITDYSSAIFDYFLLHRPVIFYVYDLDSYEGGRGMYYPFENYLYGHIAKDTSRLIDEIKKADLCDDKRASFHRKFMEACVGKSTENVIEWILTKNEIDN